MITVRDPSHEVPEPLNRRIEMIGSNAATRGKGNEAKQGGIERDMEAMGTEVCWCQGDIPMHGIERRQISTEYEGSDEEREEQHQCWGRRMMPLFMRWDRSDARRGGVHLQEECYAGR
eukprot:746116-Hanusia_phi.AAC.1